MSEKKSASEVAKGLGLTEIDTEVAVKFITRDILYTLRRSAKSKAMVAKIDKFYKELYPHGTFTDNGSKIVSTLLMGPPGHGKTTSFKVAAKIVCDGLGLRYLENAALDEVLEKEGFVTENDFVFVSEETSGLVSAQEFAGLPTTKELQLADGTTEKVMGRLFNHRLVALSKAAGGVLLLDDFMNAAPSVQGLGLSIAEEKRFGALNLTNAYIGLTGNLGPIDGTYTNKASKALVNRVKTFFTQDNVNNFVKRVNTSPMYRDELGDVGICGFLNRYNTYFASMPDPKMSGGYNTPRSWMDFMNEARNIISCYGGRQGASAAIPELHLVCSAMLGTEVANHYITYIRSMMDLADPLARSVIMDGKLDKDLLKKKFNEGYSAAEQHFAYQYALALADYAALKISKEGGELKEAVSRFALGITALDGSSFNFGINAFKSKLANQNEKLSEKNSEGTRELTERTKLEIGRIVADHPQCSKEQVQGMIDALSNFDKLSPMKGSRSRRG